MFSPSIEALTMGNCCRVMMAARTKNGMKVRRAPWRFSKEDLALLRRFTMRVRSTSNMQWTCALVRRDSIIRWAMILRIWVMGTRSPGMEAEAGVTGLADFTAGVGAADAGGAAGVASLRSRDAVMSCLLIRPPRPEPVACANLIVYLQAFL